MVSKLDTVPPCTRRTDVGESNLFREIKTPRSATLYASIWLVLALTMAVRSVASHRLIGDKLAYPAALALALATCAMWASLMPVIFQLARRYPIARNTCLRNSLAHIGFAITFALISVAWRFLLDFPFPPLRRVHGTGSTVLGIYLLTGLGRSLLVYGVGVAAAHAWSRYRMAQVPSDEKGLAVHASTASSAAGALTARFELKLNGRIYFVQPSDIDWIEAAGNYVSLHLGDKSYLLRETMHGIEGQLDPDVFVRVHRSAIVQLGRVREIQSSPGGRYQAVLKSGIRIPLGSSGIERLGLLTPRLEQVKQA